ncbi:MAG: hypothetical protein GF346_07870 [Candidatus Eisenbacteria bacterium]|nr:hypothetical protein [Candidatus Latescibacterota bacterium]MBD3302350.1 hypothetical protein [Candidatus Eisenbacteria bacterium]
MNRHSRQLGISLLAVLLLFVAGGLATGTAGGDQFEDFLPLDGGAPADTAYGGGTSPGDSNGDPDDVDISLPVGILLGNWIILL